MIRSALSHGLRRSCNASQLSSRRRPGPTTTNVGCVAMLELPLASTTQSCGYGPRPSPGRQLQDKPAQIRVLGEVADVLLHIVGVDLDGLAMAVGCGEGDIVEHALHHGLQPARADIFHRRVYG